MVGNPILSPDKGGGYVQLEVHAGMSRGTTGLCAIDKCGRGDAYTVVL